MKQISSLIKYDYTLKNVTSRKLYNNSSDFTRIINIEQENIIRTQPFNSKIDLHVYDFIQSIKFNFFVYREAYINQRKKYKLLKAYIDLSNGLIDDSKYDEIEDNCMITINDINEDICFKAIYTFLKNHDTYVDEYDINELSELLGINYIHVDKILKKRTKNVKNISKISCK